MKKSTILNRVHKDLVIPMGKCVHSLKYQKVIDEMKKFIKFFWSDNKVVYENAGSYMFSWRLTQKYLDDLINICTIYNWKFNINRYELSDYECTNIKMPERYVYTTTMWEIKDVKLIK